MQATDEDDPVADLYDGFLRRISMPEVAEEIARDVAWRRDAQRPERRAGDRIRGIGALIRSVLVPVDRREWRRAIVTWSFAAIGLGTLGLAWGRMPIYSIACAGVVLGFAGALAAAIYLSGIDLLLTRPREGRCPRCAYDLDSLPPAIDPDSTHGESAGPARCPECGLRWPMVPRNRRAR